MQSSGLFRFCLARLLQTVHGARPVSDGATVAAQVQKDVSLCRLNIDRRQRLRLIGGVDNRSL